MKKLNLQLGSIKEMLTKEQMKKVAGGYDGGGGGDWHCPAPDEFACYEEGRFCGCAWLGIVQCLDLCNV